MLRGGLVLMVWLAAGAYLLLQRFYHLPTVGAFVTPFILVILVRGIEDQKESARLMAAITRALYDGSQKTAPSREGQRP